MADRPMRTFIYGSCVSRDMMELAEPGEFEIIKYVARQSLLAAWSNASGLWPEGFQLDSAFQNRMAYNDWSGSLFSQLNEEAENIDLLLWDITDERFGIYDVEGKAHLTRTSDLMGTELEKIASAYPLIELGSETHLRKWKWATVTFAQKLKELNLFHKTVVLEVPWAEKQDDGTPIRTKVGYSPAEANKVYGDYYKIIKDAGFRVIDLSDFPIFGEPLHQWGLAPYHYTLEVYEEMVHRVRQALNELYPGSYENLAAPQTAERTVPRTYWNSVDEFLEDCTLPSGIHTINMGGLDTKVSFSGIDTQAVAAKKAQTVPVFFSGAVANRENAKPPFFSGYGITQELGLPLIAISDPLVDAHQNINIAWYIGNLKSKFQKHLANLFKGLVKNFNIEPLFVGGSAGAFAAIYYGIKTGAPAKILAWNPQTDITEYKEPFPQKFLKVAGSPADLFNSQWKENAKAWAGQNLDLALPSSEQLRKTQVALILQNRTDWHYKKHLLPWLQGTKFQHKTLGTSDLYILDDNHLIAVDDFAEGHETIPLPLVTSLLKEIINNTDTSLVFSLSREE